MVAITVKVVAEVVAFLAAIGTTVAVLVADVAAKVVQVARAEVFTDAERHDRGCGPHRPSGTTQHLLSSSSSSWSVGTGGEDEQLMR